MSKQNAKNTLRHYFQLIAERTSLNLYDECLSEIDDIIDHIVDAAVSEAKQKIKPAGAIDLRDHFAGLALQGLLSSGMYQSEAINLSYEIADKMLKRKEK